jgi:hypothetical protein
LSLLPEACRATSPLQRCMWVSSLPWPWLANSDTAWPFIPQAPEETTSWMPPTSWSSSQQVMHGWLHSWQYGGRLDTWSLASWHGRL